MKYYFECEVTKSFEVKNYEELKADVKNYWREEACSTCEKANSCSKKGIIFKVETFLNENLIHHEPIEEVEI